MAHQGRFYTLLPPSVEDVKHQYFFPPGSLEGSGLGKLSRLRAKMYLREEQTAARFSSRLWRPMRLFPESPLRLCGSSRPS